MKAVELTEIDRIQIKDVQISTSIRSCCRGDPKRFGRSFITYTRGRVIRMPALRPVGRDVEPRLARVVAVSTESLSEHAPPTQIAHNERAEVPGCNEMDSSLSRTS